MRRIKRAAMPKKWVRFSQLTCGSSTRRRYASFINADVCNGARFLSPHVLVGQPMQFVIDQRHQLVERRLVAATPILQQLRYFMWRSVHLEVSYPICALVCRENN